ncbi:MAG: polysaccharide pyruvyl transferase family protein, partial [Pseudomonadota bacterium]
MSRKLRLFWSRGTGKKGGPRNAGDWYSPLICEALAERPVVFAPVTQCDLVAVGSLLDRLQRSHRWHRLGLRRSLTLWGTGTLRAGDRLAGDHQVLALRGSATRARIAAAAPAVPLGDPGLLADRLLLQRPATRRRLGVVVHQAHLGHPELLAAVARQPDAALLPATLQVRALLEEIAASEMVLSTSLHGLIFADALAVPNTWLELPGLDGGRFKFADYYSAFGLELEPLTLATANWDEPVGT